jgi:hypothetical protein
MSKPDTTDNWMNPPKRETSWSVKSRKYPRYLIQRKRRLDYFPFTEWALWSEFTCPEDRNVALEKLRAEHPAWQLRPLDELHAPMAY